MRARRKREPNVIRQARIEGEGVLQLIPKYFLECLIEVTRRVVPLVNNCLSG